MKKIMSKCLSNSFVVVMKGTAWIASLVFGNNWTRANLQQSYVTGLWFQIQSDKKHYSDKTKCWISMEGSQLMLTSRQAKEEEEKSMFTVCKQDFFWRNFSKTNFKQFKRWGRLRLGKTNPAGRGSLWVEF